MESWGQTTVRGFGDLLKPDVLALSLAVLYAPKALFSAIMPVTIFRGTGQRAEMHKNCLPFQGRVALLNRMNFRKSSEGGAGGHFQSKKLYCRFWTFIQGFKRAFRIKIAI